MSLTSKSIGMLLEIKDPNIIFTQDAVLEEIQGTTALVLYAELKTQPERCPVCGFLSKLVRYGFERSCVLMPSYSYRPNYLNLSRQRFRCELCRSVFQSETDYVRPHSTISTPVRQMVLFEALTNRSLSDIARRFHVADKTVQRIIDEEAAQHNYNQKLWLPKHLAFDEFKATNKMSFIWGDGDRHEIGAILPAHTSYALTKYFEGFPLSVRKQVQTVSLDLNAGYINLIPRLFPNAKAVVDRFHIVQMVSTALNMVRVQVMKSLPKRSKEYRFMKREWKVFLKDFNNLEAFKPTYHVSVGYYETTVNLVAKCLDLNPEFRAAYEVYQGVLEAVRSRDAVALETILENYRLVWIRPSRR